MTRNTLFAVLILVAAGLAPVARAQDAWDHEDKTIYAVVVNAEELYGAPGDVLSRAALAINDQSGVAPRLDPAWRDYFTEHASRHWSPESPQPSA